MGNITNCRLYEYFFQFNREISVVLKENELEVLINKEVEIDENYLDGDEYEEKEEEEVFKFNSLDELLYFYKTLFFKLSEKNFILRYGWENKFKGTKIEDEVMSFINNYTFKEPNNAVEINNKVKGIIDYFYSIKLLKERKIKLLKYKSGEFPQIGDKVKIDEESRFSTEGIIVGIFDTREFSDNAAREKGKRCFMDKGLLFQKEDGSYTPFDKHSPKFILLSRK